MDLDDKILIAVTSVQIGGAETQAINLALGLKQKGYKNVSFLILSDYKKGALVTLLQKHSIHYQTVPFSAYNIDFFKKWPTGISELKLFIEVRKMLGSIKKVIKDIKPYIIVPFTYYPNIIAVTLKNVTESRIGIWNQRDLGIDGFNKNIFERKAISNADIFIANSLMCQNFLEAKRINASKINIIRNSIVDKTERTSKLQWLAKLNIEPGSKVIVKISNINPNKGHIIALKAFIELIQDSEYKNSYLIFAGRIDPIIVQPLRELVVKNNLTERVKFLGFIEDTVGLLKAADLFLFASESEGSPNAVLEAISHNTPTVTTDLPCIKEIIGDDYPYYFEINDIHGAHKMMKDLLFNKNKYDFEALGESVRNEFTLEAMTKKYLSLISR